MTKLSEIEGIGDVYQQKLNDADISSIEHLLTSCGAKKERAALAEKSGISEKLILEWVNRADLCRIKGVSTQYSDLLECAGVDSVPELAQRNAENLHEKLHAINEEKNLCRRAPSLSEVQDWVAQAKELPRAVSH